MAAFTLMKHQKKAVKFLRKMDGVGALLMDPGVGKTGSTLAYLDDLTDRYGEVRVLVVSPLTASDTWVLQVPGFMSVPTKARMMQGTTATILKKIEAARDWANVPDSKIMVDFAGDDLKRGVSGNRVTIMSMSAGAISTYCGDRTKATQMLRSIRKYAPHVVIVDESHIIKSATATISTAMYHIGKLVPHRIILTGTVNPHSPLDCYGQWRFLAPWTFSDSYGEDFTKKTPSAMTEDQKASIKPWSWTKFKTFFTTPGGFQGKGIGSYRNLEELQKRVAKRSMVVRKEDALDLPPVVDIDVHVTLSAKETKMYAEMKDQLAAQLADGTLLEAPNPLSKYMKLRQITAGLLRDTETEITHVIGDSKRKALKELVTTQLASEDRIVVFAYFRTECEQIREDLAKTGAKVEIITGATKPKDRLAIRQRFGDVSGNPERTILVAQARTMSISVNELVSAQHAIYASLSERRDDWVQSRGRLDRNGQVGKKVTFWNLIVPNTVDQIMFDNHKSRGDLEKALLDHIQGK